MKIEEETLDDLLQHPDLLEAYLNMAYARQWNANCSGVPKEEIIARIDLVQQAIDKHIEDLRAQAWEGTYWWRSRRDSNSRQPALGERHSSTELRDHSITGEWYSRQNPDSRQSTDQLTEEAFSSATAATTGE